ncbi:HD-GYP domain-containing protein [Paenibacillus harenae]|uniref:HD-GYP domain-containing protein n=1 Tax=Paenibacillus harenae TaxID=306543 RepID=UPI0003F9D2DC|nr:HD domain-containing phosphohydrolase [Paenibacillus harenae]
MVERLVRELVEGDVLAKPILGPNGMMILGRGTELTRLYIEKLTERGIAKVYIENSAESSEMEAARTVPVGQRDKQKKDFIYNDLMDRIHSKRFNTVAMSSEKENRFKRLFRNAVIDILSQPQVVDLLCRLYEWDPYIYEHSMNVAVLSGIIGTECRYDGAKMLELTIGSLLFDIGMTRLPASIVQSSGRLSGDERAVLERHTVDGYNLLMAIEGMPQLSARCALQHHEKFDGSGYPLGRQGNDIPEYAQIVAMSDIYDALISPRRYREAYKADNVIEFMLGSGNTYFNADLVKIFLKHITAFPLSSVLKLSSGQTGIVTAYSSSIAHRPVVQIIREANGTNVPSPYELDLADIRNITVVSCTG